MASKKHLSSIESTVKLNSGALMPVLGFGVFQATDAMKSCKVAFEVGYRHIDSARFYHNEEGVGEAVKSSGIERAALFLTTKVMGSEHGYKQCEDAVLDSIKSPKPNYWDLILLHDPTSGSGKRIEAYKALADAQNEGRAKSIGVSNFGVAHLTELEKANVGPVPAINQIELHPWCQQKPIVEYCRSKGIVVQAYCPLVRAKYMDDPTLVRIAKSCHKTPAQVLIRWSLQHGFVPLPKSDNPNRIKENANVFDFELNSESMAELDKLDQGDKGAISWNPVNVA